MGLFQQPVSGVRVRAASARGGSDVGHAHHRRFFVSPAAIADEHVEFEPPQAHQLARVLRLTPGAVVWVCDGTGREWEATLSLVTPRRATARLATPPRLAPAPRLLATLAQVVPRGGAMDTIVGKATELGVRRIVPLEGARSVRRASGMSARWLRIAREAAEQCGRADLPIVEGPRTLEEFLAAPPEGPLVACEGGPGVSPLWEVASGLRGAAGIALVVGAEGGFGGDEVERMRAAGVHIASLGPRRLRADTAALAALVLVQACLGDLGVVEGGPEAGNAADGRP
jgi:16S rRNA (uracil1498-N3)-methyltransferase